MTFFYSSASDEAPKSDFATVILFKSIKNSTSASCAEERVGTAGNRCTLGPKSYPSSLRPNLHLAGPGIHGQAGLARSNTGSDSCAQYALPDQGPEAAGFCSACHTTLTELGSQQSATKYSQWDAIRKRSFGLFLGTDCGGLPVSPRRFHTPTHPLPHSRESPSISSSLTFDGHISQSCGAGMLRPEQKARVA